MTLNELKKDADKYIWILNQHTWGHKAIGVERTVKIKQSNSIMFNDGSWLYYPKASESCFFMSAGDLCLAIQLSPEQDQKAQMVYTLKRKDYYDNQGINEISE